jgi:hypothetical protein
MPQYEAPPQPGNYKYITYTTEGLDPVRVIIYDDYEIDHDIIARKHGVYDLVFAPGESVKIGAGKFNVFRNNVRVITSGSGTLVIRSTDARAQRDLEAFRLNSEPAGYRVIHQE